MKLLNSFIKPLKEGDKWTDKENKKVWIFTKEQWKVDEEDTAIKFPKEIKRRGNGEKRAN